MEIISGIHQIKIPFPKGMLDYTNIYVVEGSEGNIMIDAGWDNPEAFSALREGLNEDRLKFQDIKKIVITHIHPDHYGLASKVKQLCGAKVAMHRIEAGLVDSRYVNFTELLKEMEEELSSNGVPQAELPEMKEASLWMKQFVLPDPPDIMLEDGDKLGNGSLEFEVLRTPGHSLGHICLYEPNRRLLFSGDHILFNITPHVGFHPQSGDNPLGDYISSLKMIEELRVNFVFPGHGPVFNSLKIRVAEILRHHEQRKKVIVESLSDGLKTAYQIAEEIPWVPEQRGVSFQDLALQDKRLAILETIAHLRLLMSEGNVGKIEKDGVSLYLATN
jgi:glyoxylase-like metal-dependent hydrolase (beta-lactamase superfamily II)